MRTAIITLLCSGLAAIGVVACTPYDPSLPAQPFSCGSADPKCPDGYTCTTDGSTGRALCELNGGSGTPVVDAQVNGDGANSFVCANDKASEPNETPNGAYPLTLTQDPLTVAALAICPGTDKDNFKITLTAMKNIDVKMTYDADGATLLLDIVNDNGATVTQCPSGQCTVSGGSVDAKVPNAAAGDYVIQVLGPGPTGTNGGENNYQLTITTS